MGPEIGDERIRNAAERFAPRLLGKNRITANSQNLAIDSFKVRALRFVRRNLFVSDRGERERMERQNDVLLAAIIAQLDFEPLHFGFGDDARRREIRRDIADFELSHSTSFRNL
jgi:hypothetical protein